MDESGFPHDYNPNKSIQVGSCALKPSGFLQMVSVTFYSALEIRFSNLHVSRAIDNIGWEYSSNVNI